MKLATIKPEPVHEHGDYKIEKHFAWWPRKVENKLIWLEQYKKVYCYRVRKRRLYFISASYTGVWGGWDFVTEKLINNKL